MNVGKFRKIRRIQEALDRHGPDGATLADVARELGVSRQLVWRTAQGLTNNRRILKRFLDMGVKASDLDLPKDMRTDGADAYAEAVNG